MSPKDQARVLLATARTIIAKSELEEACDALGVRTKIEETDTQPPDGFVAGTRSWRVQLILGKRKLTVPFYTGPGLKEAPTAADVLNCIISDSTSGEMSEEEFLSEFGYEDPEDGEPNPGKKVYRACKRMAPRVRKFLGDEFDSLMNKQH